MRSLAAYLRAHPLVWIVPLVFYLGLVVLLAWRVASVPANPFVYDV